MNLSIDIALVYGLYIIIVFFIISVLYEIVKEDNKYGKIRNKHILRILKGDLSLLVIHFFINLVNNHNNLVKTIAYSLDYLSLLITHLFWSTLSSIILWKLNIWPAGDAKLFIILSISIPIIFPFIPWNPKYLYIVLLFNIFIIASLFYMKDVFKKIYEKYQANLKSIEIKNIFKKISKYYLKRISIKVINSILFGTIFFNFSKVLSYYLNRLDTSDPLLFFLLYIIMEKLDKYIDKSGSFLILFFTYILIFIFPKKNIENILIVSLRKSISFNIFRSLLLLIINDYFSSFKIVKIKLDKLKPGMRINKQYILSLKEKYPDFQETFPDYEFYYCDGIDTNGVGNLIDFLKSKSCKDNTSDIITVPVIKTNPFAIWIMLGTLITVILGNKSIFFIVKFVIKKHL
jgi:hypothetical protein